MTRTNLRHGAVVTCAGKTDNKGSKCQERFYTFSFARLARQQAAASGWGRVRAWHITGDREDGTKPADCCPHHYAIAKVNAANSKQLLAAERAKIVAEKERAKADRAAAKAAKAEEKAKQIEAKAAASRARIEAREQKRQEKEARRAAREKAAEERRSASKALAVQAIGDGGAP